jgi:formiminoglutamase
MSKLDKNYHWHGREDLEDGEQGLRWHQVINQTTEVGGAALIGFACDLGVQANKGRTGAKNGPEKIRNALSNLAWHSKLPLKDLGSIVAENNLPESQQAFAKHISSALNENSLVIGLGGGHEIAWASYQGLYQHLKSSKNKKIGIINFDAHFDLRLPSPSASSGTPFRQIAEHCQQNNTSFNYACLGVAESANTPALFNYANQLNVKYILDRNCSISAARTLLKPMLEDIDCLYVSICLDAFPASTAPGVSAPSALGISPTFVIEILHWLAYSQKEYEYDWHLADIAEMNPVYDIDNRTAKLAARLIFEMVNAKS